MYLFIEGRSSNRDGPSPSRQKAGGKLNKSVRRYIILKLSGSRFRVQSSKVTTDGFCSQCKSKSGISIIALEPNGFTGLFK
jgi:hypothetical protein